MITYPPKDSHLTGFVPPRAPQRSLPATPSVDVKETMEKPSPTPLEPPVSPPDAGPAVAPDAMQVVVIRGASDLAPWVEAWQELADAAGEPNVFYEPWMLLPALEALDPKPAPEFHLVFAPGHGPDSRKPQLCGLFPLVREKGYKGVRTTILRAWKHLYCALCTPLLRRGQEVETMSALLDFLAEQKGGASLLELGYVSGDGPFGRALVETFGARGTTTFVDQSWTRAMMRPQPDTSADEYLRRGMSGKRIKEFRRKENRLGDHGEVQYTELEHEADPDAALDGYIEEFLRIEASGWKGETGSAFACHPAHQDFFRTVVTAAHERGRLSIATLRVNGQAIATKCDFCAGTGAFAFKIGFDEQYARYSPGVLLEIQGVRQVHQSGTVRWMDSCAMPNHPMINRLWLERRTLQTVVIATGRGRGEFVVSGLGLMRHFKRAARRKRRNSNPNTNPNSNLKSL